jgi:hypothetical protein
VALFRYRRHEYKSKRKAGASQINCTTLQHMRHAERTVRRRRLKRELVGGAHTEPKRTGCPPPVNLISRMDSCRIRPVRNPSCHPQARSLTTARGQLLMAWVDADGARYAYLLMEDHRDALEVKCTGPTKKATLRTGVCASGGLGDLGFAMALHADLSDDRFHRQWRWISAPSCCGPKSDYSQFELCFYQSLRASVAFFFNWLLFDLSCSSRLARHPLQAAALSCG